MVVLAQAAWAWLLPLAEPHNRWQPYHFFNPIEPALAQVYVVQRCVSAVSQWQDHCAAVISRLSAVACRSLCKGAFGSCQIMCSTLYIFSYYANMRDSFASCDSDLSLVKVGLKRWVKIWSCCQALSQSLKFWCKWHAIAVAIASGTGTHNSSWSTFPMGSWSLNAYLRMRPWGGSEALSQSEEKESEGLQILFQSWSLRALLYTLVGCTKNFGGLALYFHCLIWN